MQNAIIPHTSSAAVTLPETSFPIQVRPAELTDLSFIDELQKLHSKMVGWFPTVQLETNIKKGQVLVADSGSQRIGYCISTDRYLKHDDLGIVYQLNVAPIKQRSLVGASLVKAVFDRAAYGCKLFCCWCAQDLEANHFWESLGFVPLAFRTGSRRAGSKQEPRIHIFWQRRIREGDSETPYWFPSETSGGAVREGRLVLPIPPGTHWSDAKPAVLPGMERMNEALPAGESEKSAGKKKRSPRKKKMAAPKRPAGGLWFAPPAPTAEEKKAARAAARKVKRPKMKNDPKYVAAARELRDRYMDEINDGLLLPPSASGKYDVSRQLEAAPSAMNEVSGGPIGEMVDGNGGDGSGEGPRLLDAA